MLTVSDHSRKFAKYTYVYPVLSRRSQGISLGINLNVNNACNWRCVYCQVEGLVRGRPIDIDLEVLKFELDELLQDIVYGDFLVLHAPSNLQRLNDISISGNGEPTLLAQFKDVVDLIGELRTKYSLNSMVKSVLITNGSEIEREDVQCGLDKLRVNFGEVWFKLDGGNKRDIMEINQVNLNLEGVAKKLNLCCNLCDTYVQSCFFKQNGNTLSNQSINQYIEFVSSFKDKIAGVLLYSVARNPMLPEGKNISPVSQDFLKDIADKLNDGGINTRYYL